MALSLDVENVQKELEQCWTQRMADFERRLNAVSVPSNPSIQQLQVDFQSFKEVMLKMVRLLGQQIQDNARTIDSMDMRSRQKILIFSGISEDPVINDEQKVLSLLHNTMGLTDVSSSSLKRCHRFGNKGKNNIQPVLVHFCDHRTKADVWSRKTKLKGSPVSVAEFLTKPRQEVHKRARKHFGMRNVWTLDGTINIKLPGGTRVKIATQVELESLMLKHPSVLQPKTPESLGESAEGGLQSKANPNHQHQVSQKNQVASVTQAEDKRARRPARR